jgi:hypothetical protein
MAAVSWRFCVADQVDIVEFVPDDQLHRRPANEVREPDPENELAEG